MPFYYAGGRRESHPHLPQHALASQEPKEKWIDFLEVVFGEDWPTKRKPLFDDDRAKLKELLFDPTYNYFPEYLEEVFEAMQNNTLIGWLPPTSLPHSTLLPHTRQTIWQIINEWWDRCLAKELLMMEEPKGAKMFPCLAHAVKSDKRQLLPLHRELRAWLLV